MGLLTSAIIYISTKITHLRRLIYIMSKMINVMVVILMVITLIVLYVIMLFCVLLCSFLNYCISTISLGACLLVGSMLYRSFR